MKWDVLIIRVGFVGLLVLLGYSLMPIGPVRHFGLNSVDDFTRRELSALLGGAIGLLIIGFEMWVKRSSLKTLIGAAVGSILRSRVRPLSAYSFPSKRSSRPAEISHF